MQSKNKFILAVGGVILVFIFWIYWVSTNEGAGEQTLVKFISVEDLKEENPSTRIRLGGLVQEGSIIISEDNLLDMQFVLEQGEGTVPVRYGKTRPDLFKDGAEVIVEGTYKKGTFHADMLQTKCASRYEGDLRDESTYDLETLEL